MYVQFKNYFLGKTTHERFSKRAALSQTKLENSGFTSEDSTTTPLRKVANEVNQDSTAADHLLPQLEAGGATLKKQKRGCCFNCKRMMYHKEKPT